MAVWDIANVQSQIRLTAFRLGQLRERHKQTSNITKRDVATLISQAEIPLARSKVEKLVRDDKLNGLIERLEFYCSQLLEKAAELGGPIDFESESPLLEAVCSVMLVASRTELKDVTSLRDMLVKMYGPEFNQLAVKNHANHVPVQVINALDKRPPPATQMDVYMASISNEYNLSWRPPLLPHQKSHALSEILDEGAFPHTIDIRELRQICSRGIPSQPPWLRPRVWKLLLGTISQQKDSWEVDAHSKRRSYYDLARPLLSRLNALPPPSTPLSPLDASLLGLAKALSHLPQELDRVLEQSPLCPFDSNAPDGLRIEEADALDQRLRLISGQVNGTSGVSGTPEIRLGPADPTSLQMPQISVSSPIHSPTDDEAHKTNGTVLHPSVLTRRHATSLMRLLYIHMALHPSAPTLYLTSILIPLYVAMLQEVEPAELAHIEPDAFWLFTELCGEVGELAENEGTQTWVAKFGQRLAWADPELHGDLCRKGLDPTLPHYSYRWLVPLLTRTLRFPSVLTIWDAMFSQPSRTSDHNAKLEFLVDICASMLINARVKLIRLGRPAVRSPGLWGDVDVTIAAPSHTPVEFEEGFTHGMALLQAYPIDELGGPERIIDTAIGLDNQRKLADRKGGAGFNLGERLRGTVWSTLMTRATPVEPSIPESNNESDSTPSPEWPDSGAEDEGDATGKPNALLSKLGNTVWRGLTNQSSMDAPASPLPPAELSSPISHPAGTPLPNPTDAGGIGSRLGNSIWRGLTNQSAMDAPPSPTESPVPSPPGPESDAPVSPSASSALWGYTGKLKDSDAAASLSKTSTNWSARASTLWRRSNPLVPLAHPNMQHTILELESRYYSPQERTAPASPSKPVLGSPSPLLAKSKSALASLTGNISTASSKSAPRPLLLSSSSLITPSNPRLPSRSLASVTASHQAQDTISPARSTSTSLSVLRSSVHSDRDSEPSNGRFVPLRRSVSPRPPHSSHSGVARSDRESSTQPLKPATESEPLRAPFRTHLRHERRRSSEDSARRELPDSPSTIPSSPPPKTPTTVGTNERHSSIELNLPGMVQTPRIDKHVGRKKSWNTASGPSVTPRKATYCPSVRSKRYGPRPTHLRLKKSDTDFGRSSQATIVESRNSVDVTSLVPEGQSDVTANTPRATEFSSPGSPERPTRIRKNSRSPRPALRKIELPTTGSFSSDGDDEGYDDFLSAYESEDGPRTAAI
ncbi:regulator of Vps4 activity in the MVB pathway-domain-containing protein [Gautieria morchelliformis]|nr:regulator of Vps4 activity in the MVB pathway-domain-containing protein [Gautieria morchelliformis]